MPKLLPPMARPWTVQPLPLIVRPWLPLPLISMSSTASLPVGSVLALARGVVDDPAARPEQHCVAGARDRLSRDAPPLVVGGCAIGLLAPGAAHAREHVGRPGISGTVVALGAVHPGGAAVLAIRPDHHGVA